MASRNYETKVFASSNCLKKRKSEVRAPLPKLARCYSPTYPENTRADRQRPPTCLSLRRLAGLVVVLQGVRCALPRPHGASSNQPPGATHQRTRKTPALTDNDLQKCLSPVRLRESTRAPPGGLNRSTVRPKTPAGAVRGIFSDEVFCFKSAYFEACGASDHMVLRCYALRRDSNIDLFMLLGLLGGLLGLSEGLLGLIIGFLGSPGANFLSLLAPLLGLLGLILEPWIHF